MGPPQIVFPPLESSLLKFQGRHNSGTKKRLFFGIVKKSEALHFFVFDTHASFAVAPSFPHLRSKALSPRILWLQRATSPGCARGSTECCNPEL